MKRKIVRFLVRIVGLLTADMRRDFVLRVIEDYFKGSHLHKNPRPQDKMI